ncbi:hypothetical protein H6G17_29270 [Chroococcidiopsis sp. FACHB-1243]|uniref:element excision factor XisH family protein n=1 Tax=Chroococcidiopsis sp. [FACHB-1243] TaxID=2692781 RepID=UPI00177DE1ED|nr:hypothetical protein [Chroococcidiopsis sp. [FACHB-1243]]
MARDAFHAVVRVALERQGWSITHDPYSLRVGGVEMFVDLGAERLIAAVEIDLDRDLKSFRSQNSRILI